MAKTQSQPGNTAGRMVKQYAEKKETLKLPDTIKIDALPKTHRP